MAPVKIGSWALVAASAVASRRFRLRSGHRRAGPAGSHGVQRRAAVQGEGAEDMIRYAIPKPHRLRIEHENLRDALLGRLLDIVTMEQGLMTVAVAEAMIESARSRLTVSVERPL